MKTAANAPVNTVTILTASDPGQDEARQAWNLTADQRPAAIARPRPAGPVPGMSTRRAARAFARDAVVDLTLRTGPQGSRAMTKR